MMLLSVLRLTRIALRAMWLAGVIALIGFSAGPSLLRLAGFDTFTVRGGSMSPAIPLAAVVVVQHVPAATLSAGDVVTFRAANDTVVTHRVIGRSAGGAPTFITQGDANPTPDPDFVTGAAVIGRVVVSVPIVGGVLVALSTIAGMLIVAALLGCLMVGGWFLDELGAALTVNRRTATKLAV